MKRRGLSRPARRVALHRTLIMAKAGHLILAGTVLRTTTLLVSKLCRTAALIGVFRAVYDATKEISAATTTAATAALAAAAAFNLLARFICLFSAASLPNPKVKLIRADAKPQSGRDGVL